jgi:hypothetical protein
MMRPGALRLFVWLTPIVLVLAGCGEPVDQPPTPAPDAPAETETPPASPDAAAAPVPTAPVPGAPEAAPLAPEKTAEVLAKKTVEIVYDPINRPDPFKPYIEVPPPIDSTAGPTLFELRFYTLRAVAWGGPKPLAMVVDPKGMSYAVRVGDVIGRGEDVGTITAIQPDKIVVSKQGFDFMKRPITRSIEIQLHPESEQLQGGR